jgi:UDP-N-acetyl-alpha-D-quinovosamine dehydrogenase
VVGILVTGAGGFIGRALCPALAAQGHRVWAGLRAAAPQVAGAEPRVLGTIAPGGDWSKTLAGVEIVIHLAQIAHRHAAPSVLAGEPVAAAALARSAARAGVRRLVYLSSIKAMGDATAPGRPLRPDDPPHPEDAYGRMKLASERALAASAAEGGIELAILRPPLVYGPGAGGNFRALARLAASGLPLPFAAVANRRSLLFRDNLVDLVASAITHPGAAGRVLLAADLTLATPALIRLLAAARGRRARLFALPDAAFAGLRRMPGIGPALSRLTLSLEVDDGPTRAALGWAPRYGGEAALAAAAGALAAA